MKSTREITRAKGTKKVKAMRHNEHKANVKNIERSIQRGEWEQYDEDDEWED